MASAITGTVAGLEAIFHRTLRRWTAALLFSICFFADASFMVWQDGQNPLPQSPITAPASPPAIAVQPAAVPQAMTDEAFTRRLAQTLGSDIMRFYVSRDVMQPRALTSGNPGTPEWDAVEEARAAYKRETVSTFQARFGVDILRVTDRLIELHLNTGGIEVMYRELSDPPMIRTLATQLTAISKEEKIPTGAPVQPSPRQTPSPTSPPQ